MLNLRRPFDLSRPLSRTASNQAQFLALRQRDKLTILLLVLFAICIFDLPAQAKYGGGSGTAEDPFRIYDANQMNAIGADSNDWDKHFRLMADINLSIFTGTEFNVIGRGRPEFGGHEPFTGTFDGNHHEISNFTYETALRSNSIGIFGSVYGEDSEIKNLTLRGPHVHAGAESFNVGCIAGAFGSGSVYGCCVEGASVSGANYVGGMFGICRGTISDCFAEGNISGSGVYIGGLAGCNGSGVMTGCYSSGVVFGMGLSVGGLVGTNTGMMSNCNSSASVSGSNNHIGGLAGTNSEGTITKCHATGSVSGYGGLGGLVGNNMDGGTISECYATASVTGSNGVAGGLVGIMQWDGTIANCYATGSVSGGAQKNGGLIGIIHIGMVTYCYSTGRVEGNSSLIGGLVGDNETGHITNSFWDIETSGQTSSDGGTGKTTNEMQTESTFTDAGWDLTTPIWKMCGGPYYPRLWWEKCPERPIYYVDSDANGANDGSSWVDAFNYLQDALADAYSSVKPVEIHVAQGIYKPDQAAPLPPPPPPPPPSQASNPNPANGATEVCIYADLGWTARSATSHDVYFGISNPPPFIGNQTSTTFDPCTMDCNMTYYWRIDSINISGKTTGAVWRFTTAVSQSPPPDQASNPNPADGTTGVNITSDLSWTASPCATSHDVYFGTSSPPMFIGNQTATTFDPGTMVYETAYYWRIDEINPSGTTTGTFWSFTTNSEPPPPPPPPPPPGSLRDNWNDMETAPITAGDREATFQLINFVTIKGGYAGLGEPDPDARDIQLFETILSGDLNGDDGPYFANNSENSYHVVTGSGCDKSAVLDGFTITGGNANGTGEPNDRGGGMYINKGSPTLINCMFTRNTAFYGGGMYNYFGSPALEDCTFAGNSTAYYIDQYRGGGGMYNYFGSPTLKDCTFAGNSTFGSDLYDGGGGMYNHSCSPVITNCIFRDNFAIYGGGMNNLISSPTLKNCTFIKNSVSHSGGGMQNILRSNPTLTNCTFSGNRAWRGGGILNHHYCIPTLFNCILWGNTGSEGSQIYNNITSSTNVSYSDVRGGWPGEGNIDADPCFADADNGDYHMKSRAGRWDANSQTWVKDNMSSSCIDVGDWDSDWSGELWPHGERINMGAFGGTSEASMSLWDAGSIADLNIDGRIDSKDMMLLTDKWLHKALLQREDLNRDGIINLADFAIFAYIRGLPCPASEPNPTDKAIGVNITAELTWTAGSYATSHDVYFGTSSQPPFIGNQTSTTFDPGTMDYSTQYYWRVDEIGAYGAITGVVWSFTTIMSPPPPPPPPT